MDSKRWTYVYKTIKNYFREHEGQMPDDDVVIGIYGLYKKIMNQSANERAESKKMDDQIKTLFGYLFAIVHSLELEKKPL